MKILGFEISKSKTAEEKKPKKPRSRNVQRAEANGIVRSWSVDYDGEKNSGEIGPVIDYRINFSQLSNRSWQSFLESDISQTVLNRYTIWIIDKGLKLQSKPVRSILQANDINFDIEDFNNKVEDRFKIWSNSKRSSYNGMKSFNSLSKAAFKNSKVGGDVLTILRLVKGVLTVQLVDGRHVQSPFINDLNSNRIRNGVEIDSSGRHIAYWVKESTMKFNRIEAWDSITGLRIAFLVYGSEYRLDDNRGLPKIAVSLESIAKIDRYKEATTGSAEERAKIPYFITHDANSDGENPLGDFASAFDDGDNDGDIPVDEVGNALAKEVTATTNKMTFNMPKGSKIESLGVKAEVAFKEFYSTNADIICAAVGIPPNVAFSVYNDSFSASRAATKDWDHTIGVDRDDFYEQFYSHVYAYWLHIEVISLRIQAPGYLKAFTENNWQVIEAYLHSEFVGPMFPHIDPLKEVKAERAKLGPKGDNIPLTTIEAATLNVGSGEATGNIEQFAKEIDLADQAGLIDKTPDSVPIDNSGSV